MPEARLSPTSVVVLEMIAAGSTYEQILSAYPELTYLDIFHAAEEALDLAATSGEGRGATYTLAEKRERHRRAYEKWDQTEDELLRELVRSGETVARIAGRLERNRGAIRARILSLGLENELPPAERDRLRRIVERDGESSQVPEG
jgi:hypothetical protein